MDAHRHLLTDLGLELGFHNLRPRYTVAEVERRIPRRGGTAGNDRRRDLATTSGKDNLGQAVVLRLLTPRGELAALGHPDYGSRLHELIGLPNTATTRGRVRLAILESLGQEPRIAAVEEVVVEPAAAEPDRVDVTLRVMPAEATAAVTLGPFTLRLAP